MYFYNVMSDLSRFLQTPGNIGEKGQERLQQAKDAISQGIGKQNLTRSIEAGLGGMKVTTFGSKVFKGVEEAGSPYLKQQISRLESAAKDAAGNVWESAKSALADRDATGPIQMTEIEPAGGQTEASAAEGASPQEIADAESIARTGVPARPLAPKPEEGPAPGEPPELPDASLKPSPGELRAPETAAEGDEGGVAIAASEEGGLITGTEALSAVLDATGIGAPLGLLVGAVGVGLALKKDKPVTEKVDQSDTGGMSYQVGI